MAEVFRLNLDRAAFKPEWLTETDLGHGWVDSIRLGLALEGRHWTDWTDLAARLKNPSDPSYSYFS